MPTRHECVGMSLAPASPTMFLAHPCARRAAPPLPGSGQFRFGYFYYLKELYIRTCLSANLYICESVYPSIDLSMCLPVYLSVHLSPYSCFKPSAARARLHTHVAQTCSRWDSRQVPARPSCQEATGAHYPGAALCSVAAAKAQLRVCRDT